MLSRYKWVIIRLWNLGKIQEAKFILHVNRKLHILDDNGDWFGYYYDRNKFYKIVDIKEEILDIVSYGLSNRIFSIVKELCTSNGITIKELSDKILLSQDTIINIIDKQYVRELITLHDNKLFLTDFGKEICRRVFNVQ